MKNILKCWLMKGFLLLLFIFVLLIWSLEVKAEKKPVLAILPFFVERVEDPGRGAVCPVCKGVYRRGEIVPGSQNTLTRLLYEKMESSRIFHILSLKKVEDVPSCQDRRLFEERPVPSVIRAGKELKADFIFVGYLFRFEERIGSSLGVERPASVSFDLHLFRLRDERMVWEGKFDETQRPLSEDLFRIGSFFRRKASWLTAEELASVGMDEILKRMPVPQELMEK